MVGFGRRWAVETAIGSFKATFGECVMARTLEAAQLEAGPQGRGVQPALPEPPPKSRGGAEEKPHQKKEETIMQHGRTLKKFIRTPFQRTILEHSGGLLLKV